MVIQEKKKKKKKPSIVQIEKPVNTKISTIQINNNGYIGRKEKGKKKLILYRLTTMVIQGEKRKEKKRVLYRLKTSKHKNWYCTN